MGQRITNVRQSKTLNQVRGSTSSFITIFFVSHPSPHWQRLLSFKIHTSVLISLFFVQYNSITLTVESTTITYIQTRILKKCLIFFKHGFFVQLKNGHCRLYEIYIHSNPDPKMSHFQTRFPCLTYRPTVNYSHKINWNQKVEPVHRSCRERLNTFYSQYQFHTWSNRKSSFCSIISTIPFKSNQFLNHAR
jgi:hypothetical protein